MGYHGLVLEGGGMRGVYTAGVLDFFLKMDIYFPYIIGVSAGACNAASYISEQMGRNKVVQIDYVNHPNFFGVRNLIQEKSLFGMKLIFEDIPKNLEPFHFNKFFNSKQKFVITTTDIEKGKPYYIDKDEIKQKYSYNDINDKMLQAIKASSSIPFISPSVKFDEKLLVDGGVSDPIPIRKAEQDGIFKNVVVLTRNEGYRKKPFKYGALTKRFYNDKIADLLTERHKVYNDTLDYINELEKKGEVFVIRPSEPLKVNKFETNKRRLENLYYLGFRDALNKYNSLLRWMQVEYKNVINI